MGAPPPPRPQGLYSISLACVLASFRHFSSFSLLLRASHSLIWKCQKLIHCHPPHLNSVSFATTPPWSTFWLSKHWHLPLEWVNVYWIPVTAIAQVSKTWVLFTVIRWYLMSYLLLEGLLVTHFPLFPFLGLVFSTLSKSKARCTKRGQEGRMCSKNTDRNRHFTARAFL